MIPLHPQFINPALFHNYSTPTPSTHSLVKFPHITGHALCYSIKSMLGKSHDVPSDSKILPRTPSPQHSINFVSTLPYFTPSSTSLAWGFIHQIMDYFTSRAHCLSSYSLTPLIHLHLFRLHYTTIQIPHSQSNRYNHTLRFRERPTTCQHLALGNTRIHTSSRHT